MLNIIVGHLYQAVEDEDWSLVELAIQLLEDHSTDDVEDDTTEEWWNWSEEDDDE